MPRASWRCCSIPVTNPNAAIKTDFEKLYRLINGKPLKEIDEIICAICTLCSNHEKAGFIEGIKVGVQLAQEGNIT